MTVISQALVYTSRFSLNSAVTQALQKAAKCLKKSKNTDKFISPPTVDKRLKSQELIYGNKNILKLTYAGKNILGSGGQAQQQAGVITQLRDGFPAIHRPVAIKFFNEYQNHHYTQERKALLANSLSPKPHPHLQQTIPNDKNLIATPLAVTDLCNYINTTEEANKPLSLAQKLKLILQTASGLQYLHRLGFLHLDIKPENILINAAGEAVLCDLGGHTNDTVREHNYFGFRVPEGDENVSTKSDVFILSAMITNLLSGYKIQLYDHEGDVKHAMTPSVRKHITNELHNSLLKQTKQINPSACRHFAQSLGQALHPEPQQRLALDKLITALQVFSDSLTPAPTTQPPLISVQDLGNFKIRRPTYLPPPPPGQYPPNPKGRKVTFADNAQRALNLHHRLHNFPGNNV